jgi:hypothetical protein
MGMPMSSEDLASADRLVDIQTGIAEDDQRALLRDALRVLNRYAVTLPAPDLAAARAALEEHMFDESGVQRDDVLSIAMKIDDAST